MYTFMVLLRELHGFQVLHPNRFPKETQVDRWWVQK